MAKNPQSSSAPQTSAINVGAIDIPASAGGDSRRISFKVPMADGSEKTMTRTDYIRQRWTDGADRGTIRKEVEALGGKTIQYQVVFAATKGIEGGPKDKKTAAAAPASAPSGASE